MPSWDGGRTMQGIERRRAGSTRRSSIARIQWHGKGGRGRREGGSRSMPVSIDIVCSSFRKELLPNTRRIAISRWTLPVGAAVASSAEPKWKLKLAAADEHAEKTRRATAQAQEEYNKRQQQIRRQQDLAEGDIGSLGSLDYIPYLTDEGKITNCSKVDAKATVYAIFNEAKTLQYVGVTRGVYPSMKLHFARVPSKCFYVKMEHLAKPSRSLLESIRDKWIADNGFSPPGNDNGEQQKIWENPLDCKFFMTDKEKELLTEAAPGPPTAKVLKNVARRLEASLLEDFKQRNCTENMRFDPKLKDRGLLDLKNSDPKKSKREPDSAVPTTTVQSQNVAAA